MAMVGGILIPCRRRPDHHDHSSLQPKRESDRPSLSGLTDVVQAGALIPLIALDLMFTVDGSTLGTRDVTRPRMTASGWRTNSAGLASS
jgi:hypothetical protein